MGSTVADSVSIDAIRAAYTGIQPYILETPLLESARINELFGKRILFKAECLQKTGSFKIRGATHFIQQLTPAQKQQGVVAYSSGNHAQAVAAAAQLAGIQATIIMPQDAPQLKIEGTRFYGANVILYNRYSESRETIAQAEVERTGAVLLPPYDHVYTMQGQGTVGLEIIQQCNAQSVEPQQVLVPCSGGGLLAGCSVAVHSQWPNCAMVAVEPAGYHDTQLSLEAGTRIAITPEQPSLCDALLMTQPGALTFPVNQQHTQCAVTVLEQSVLKAMQLIFLHLKLVVEPGGAVGLAAMMEHAALHQANISVILLSGGNVDPRLFKKALNAE